MKRLIALSSLLTAMNAHAVMTPVSTLGEWGSSASTGMQGIIDARGNSLVSIGNDSHQVDDASDSHWSASGSLSAGMVIELAGFAPNNSFGIYNALNPSERMEIFGGSAVAGDTTGAIPGTPFSTFGFYLENTKEGFTHFSDSSLNEGGLDHMVAYAGQGETLNLGDNPDSPAGSFVWDSDTLLLGWEDLSLGDADYNDMIVMIRNVRSPSSIGDALTIPESVPDTASTASLLGLSLLALGLARRRKIN